jgi:hypothetical protein
VFLLRCKACAAKDAELERAHERELELLRMVQELQYAIHPARMTKPADIVRDKASVTIPQVIQLEEIADAQEGTSLRTVSRETNREFPRFVSSLQYGGHIPPRMLDDLRMREGIRKGTL